MKEKTEQSEKYAKIQLRPQIQIIQQYNYLAEERIKALSSLSDKDGKIFSERVQMETRNAARVIAKRMGKLLDYAGMAMEETTEISLLIEWYFTQKNVIQSLVNTTEPYIMESVELHIMRVNRLVELEKANVPA